ncbi:MAG: class I mannose-6-phosphate isomerase [Bryobacteraceae bacterium]|nr:class I mannose-6-phosphate isomerase [Bryobacteraceae bacterium]
MSVLTPVYHEKIWGSADLAPWFPAPGGKIGEVWLDAGPRFPLLVKFLFTTDKLSVQVHPDDARAARENSRGKTEMWHVLRAGPDACVAVGFRRPISPETLKAAAVSGEIESLLNWISVKPGDTVFVPAGTVHAIGAGLVLCEIQQRSDITYRLYDYGRPRELHLDKAVEAADCGCHPGVQLPRGQTLAECGHFRVDRLRVEGSARIAPKPDELLIAIEGAGQLDGEPWRAGEARIVLGAGPEIELRGGITVLRAWAPSS